MLCGEILRGASRITPRGGFLTAPGHSRQLGLRGEPMGAVSVLMVGELPLPAPKTKCFVSPAKGGRAVTPGAVCCVPGREAPPGSSRCASSLRGKCEVVAGERLPAGWGQTGGVGQSGEGAVDWSCSTFLQRALRATPCYRDRWLVCRRCSRQGWNSWRIQHYLRIQDGYYPPLRRRWAVVSRTFRSLHSWERSVLTLQAPRDGAESEVQCLSGERGFGGEGAASFHPAAWQDTESVG